LQKKGYDGFVADIWSCGVILYVMVSGRLPFEDDTINGLFTKIQKGTYDTPNYFSSDLKKLISKMLVVDPSKRISLQDIFDDPWFKIGFTKEESKVVDMSNPISDFENAEEEKEKNKKIKKKIEYMTAFDLPTLLVLGKLNPLQGTVIKRETRFMVKGSLKEVFDHFEKSITDIDSKCKIMPKLNTLKIHLQDKGNVLVFVIEILPIVGGVNLCEIKKVKGEILQFNDIYRKIVEKSIDIICKKKK